MFEPKRELVECRACGWIGSDSEIYREYYFPDASCPVCCSPEDESISGFDSDFKYIFRHVLRLIVWLKEIKHTNLKNIFIDYKNERYEKDAMLHAAKLKKITIEKPETLKEKEKKERMCKDGVKALRKFRESEECA